MPVSVPHGAPILNHTVPLSLGRSLSISIVQADPVDVCSDVNIRLVKDACRDVSQEESISRAKKVDDGYIGYYEYLMPKSYAIDMKSAISSRFHAAARALSKCLEMSTEDGHHAVVIHNNFVITSGVNFCVPEKIYADELRRLDILIEGIRLYLDNVKSWTAALESIVITSSRAAYPNIVANERIFDQLLPPVRGNVRPSLPGSQNFKNSGFPTKKINAWLPLIAGENAEQREVLRKALIGCLACEISVASAFGSDDAGIVAAIEKKLSGDGWANVLESEFMNTVVSKRQLMIMLDIISMGDMPGFYRNAIKAVKKRLASLV